MPAETHVEQGPMDRQEVFELIRDRLADILEIEPSAINEGDSFADDLEADSLALIELVEALEEELGERTVGLPHRRRGPRGPEDGARRRRLRRRPAVGDLSRWTPDPIMLARRAPRPRRSPTPSCWPTPFVHRSWCAEHPGHASNERLEFLGDAVLGLVVTDHIFTLYPDLAEGWLSPSPRGASCAPARWPRWPTSCELGDAPPARQGRGASGGRAKPSILADALEAVIGAVYLDGGWAPARTFVLGLVRDRLDALVEARRPDYKSRLQELAAATFDTELRYDVAEAGPDHAKTFTARRGGRRRLLGRGEGRSKKQAEQVAANEALLTPRRGAGRSARRGSENPVRGPGCLSCPRSRRSAASWTRGGRQAGQDRRGHRAEVRSPDCRKKEFVAASRAPRSRRSSAGGCYLSRSSTPATCSSSTCAPAGGCDGPRPRTRSRRAPRWWSPSPRAASSAWSTPGGLEVFVATPDELLERGARAAALGLDPVDEPISWTPSAGCCSSRATKLKPLLMDPTRRRHRATSTPTRSSSAAGLRHDRESHAARSQEIRRLYRALVETLHEAVKHRGSTLADGLYVDLSGKPGDYQDELKVYERDGQACRRCRGVVAKAKLSGKVVYYCPECQV